MSETAELKGVLTVDDREFIQKMFNATEVAKKSGKKIESNFEGISSKLAAIASIGVIGGIAKELGDFGSAIKDQADTTSLSTDVFQQYSFAVSQAGGSQEVFVKGIIALQQSMEGAKNGTETTIDSFDKLGISLADLRDAKPEQVLLKVADALRDGKGDAAIFAAVADLIGVKVATKLVPSLKDGGDEFLKLAKSASIASKEAVDAAESAQDAWDAFLRGVKTQGLEAFNFVEKRFQKDIAPAGGVVGGAFGEKPDLGALKSQLGAPLVPPEDDTEPRMPYKGSRDAEATRRAKQALADEAEEDKKNADFVEKDLQNRQKMYLDILQINEETWYVQRDMNRSTMSAQELIVDLQKERAYWVSKALKDENDIFGLHKKEAAEARLKAAKLNADIQKAKADLPKTPSQSFFEQRAQGMMDDMMNQSGISNFSNAGVSGKGKASVDRFAGNLTTGGLATGGLTTGGGFLGGMGDPYHLVRSGDRARAAAEAKKAKDPVEANTKATAESVANLAEQWGATGVRP